MAWQGGERLARRRFEFLEHTADVFIVAYGRKLEEAFENAALATFEVMTDTSKVAPRQEETLKVEGHDEKALLYNWLENLIVKFEIKEILYSKFHVHRIQKTNQNNYRLEATIGGEKFSPERHTQKVGIKAVTYHLMEIKRRANRVRVQFILDI
ncbi:MAG: archease [Candidatus Bathyarchaeota archaeon]|nr:archease [Candidatus Bathyarchaeota archaeon]